MPGKKPPPKKPRAASGPAWQVILEEMRSQNRATIEAVQSTRTELKQEIAELRENTTARFQTLESAVQSTRIELKQEIVELRENTTARFQTLESAVRQNSTDIQALRKDVRNVADKVEQNGADIRHLDEKVDNLSGLEARVSALERQRG
jgi:archaellum component FlaC